MQKPLFTDGANNAGKKNNGNDNYDDFGDNADNNAHDHKDKSNDSNDGSYNDNDDDHGISSLPLRSTTRTMMILVIILRSCQTKHKTCCRKATLRRELL